MIERRESDFTALVGDDFRGAGDEFAHVFDTLLPFRPFCTQMIGVLDGGGEIT